MTTADEICRDRTERWFVRQGLPNLIDNYSVREDVLTRMVPFLGLVVFLELFLVFGDRWKGVSQGLAFAGGVALVVGAFMAVNLLRGRRPLMLPDTAGAPELVLFFVLSSIPTAIGAEDARSEDLLVVFGLNVVIVAVAFVVTAWGIIPMVRWSVGQMLAQINNIADLTMTTLPILLIFSAVIFLNAEMWQVANDFTMPLFLCVLAVVVLIGSSFVMLSVRRITVDLARFEKWSDVRPFCEGTPVADRVPDDVDPEPHSPPLGRRAEWNVALLLFVSQAIQILVVALAITAFYLIFGLLTVRADTVLQWTTAGELTAEKDWLVNLSLFGDELVFTRQLVLVSAFIGSLSGLQFAVQLVTNDGYRSDFAEGMTAELREALAVRAVYLRVLVPT